MATIFPVILKQPDDMYTAMQTSQLHRTDRVKATVNGNDTFVDAILKGRVDAESVPAFRTRAAKTIDPMKLATYETDQDFSNSFNLICPSIQDVVT